MSATLYKELNAELQESAKAFSLNNKELVDEVNDDISTIIDVFDVKIWKPNIDGEVKSFSVLLQELRVANRNGDRQKCIESIAMLRVAISNIASAYSNAMDSMEELAVAIRDGAGE